MDRRQFIVTAGTATAIGLAGCLGDEETEDEAKTDSPETVAEVYLEMNLNEDGVEDLLHPESPIDFDDFDDGGIEFESLDADTEVAEEDIDSGELTAFDPDMEDSPMLIAESLTDEELDQIAVDETVTLVVADLDIEVSGDDEEANELKEIHEDEPAHLITATDDGDWFILDEISYHYGSTQPTE